jgi:mRNA interferase RelE/StbE
MTYRVEISRKAAKALAALPAKAQTAIASAITALADEPRPAGCTKLTNSDAYRIRIGDYRVIYTINDGQLIVTVVKTGHRREVYR